MKKWLLTLLLVVSASTDAAVSFGSDYAISANTTGSSFSGSLTLGSTGADSILFVEIESGADYSALPAPTYNGAALTSLGGKVLYAGSATIYKEVWYLNANLTSGQTLSITSGAPTTLGQGGAKTWHHRYWTYGGVSGLGTTSVNATNFTTSGSGAPVTTAFNFTPTSASSTIIQLLAGQGSTCPNGYSPANGTIREVIFSTTSGAASVWFSFSDYAPGSTSLYILSQDWVPQFCGNTGYGWGIELLEAGGGGGTPTPTPVRSIDFLPLDRSSLRLGL